MIPLVLKAQTEPGMPYVTRLSLSGGSDAATTASFLGESSDGALFAGDRGLLALTGVTADSLDGDVVLVTPADGRAERLFRANSTQNTLLVTERCDQLCLMCSQPPKKTHLDRFALFADACMLAAPNALIGISGGEPTLYKKELFDLAEDVLAARPDLSFHILSNGQHIEEADIDRLSGRLWRRVAWGIPLYAADDALHDEIVAKSGAAARLRQSLARLFRSNARIELRTVVLQQNITVLPALADHVAIFFRPIEQWSIMQLENAGFARGRWARLYADHSRDFSPIASAIDRAELAGVSARLFNFPRCTVPNAYRDLALVSISDWKRRFVPGCEGCREQARCTGFFEWHPDGSMEGVTPL